jgi:hypothetical protein
MDIASIVVSSILSIAALVVSIFAHKHASKVLRLEHRPLVRVELGEVILKNVGRGPALTVVAFDPASAALLGEVPLVEPLGGGEDEASRIGRVRLPLHGRMVMSSDYALYYQDTLGEWHLTQFRPKPGKIECTFVGAVKSVPREVEPLGTILKPRR